MWLRAALDSLGPLAMINERKTFVSAVSASGNADELTKARELYSRMKLGAWPEPAGDEFDLFFAIVSEVQCPKTWVGGELDVKTRSLCTIAALIASGKPQVQGHIRAALAVGASRQEIAGVVTHIAFYAGFPAAANALRAAREVFGEMALDNPTSLTGSHDGQPDRRG